MAIDVGNSVVNVLLAELGAMQKDVMQLSSDLRSKVDPLGREKAGALITRFRNDVRKLVARHEALAHVASQTDRAELLDLFDARLDTADELLEYAETTLQATEGLEPVALGADDAPVIRVIGVPRANGSPSTPSAESSPRVARVAPATDALPPRTPARSKLNGYALATPARARPAARRDDSLPPTPKLADFGLSDVSLAHITQARHAFAKNIRLDDDDASDLGSASFAAAATHVLHEDTSPAADDDPADITYDETISKQMQRMRLRPWELGD